MTTADQVRRLIAQHLGIEASRVTDEALFRVDLGADSLDAFELLMTFEDAFGLEIPDAAADPMSASAMRLRTSKRRWRGAAHVIRSVGRRTQRPGTHGRECTAASS